MNLPRKVTIVEVGTRDGFQNENQFIPTERKIEIINALSLTGWENIQANSFVHPKAVSQLADAEEVMSCIDRVRGISYKLPRLPVRMGSHDFGVRGPAPAVGEGAYELLKSLSFSDPEIEEMRKEKILAF